MTNCPCGNQLPFNECCGLYIENHIAAPTPSTLMRSRYSAYRLCNIDYIAKTMKGAAAKDFDFAATKQWAQSVQWLGLTVVSEKMKSSTKGFVIFEAKYSEKGHIRVMREKSEFHLIEGHWYYVAGKTLNPHQGLA